MPSIDVHDRRTGQGGQPGEPEPAVTPYFQAGIATLLAGWVALMVLLSS